MDEGDTPSTVPAPIRSGDPDGLSAPPDERLRAIAGMRPVAPPIADGTVIGDYAVSGQIGAGGMGVVYRARDRHLGRLAALKLHAQAGGERLLREASAMARLAHPNVATVYAVGTHEGRLYIAMEHCAGGTARTWLEARPRSWREIVTLYAAAGRGLAAAHDAGFVHRDFKPDNVLIGGDGRPRVADFGLVRSDDRDEPVGEGGAPPAHDATATGAVLGTLPYLAPELRTGGAATVASDQFAFAVALSEALHGVRPFDADGAPIPRTGSDDVPGWLERVVARGMASDPAARWPSLAAMVAALEDDPALRRRRIVVAATAAVVVIAAIGLVWWWARREDPKAACARAGDRASELWNDARRADLQAAFARSGRPHADDVAARVIERLDGWARGWAGARIEACEATRVRGEQSDAAYDRRIACLDRHGSEAAALIGVLSGAAVDVGVVDHAAEAIDSLPPLSDCDDADALARVVPLPDDPAQRSRISGLETRLANLSASRLAGQGPSIVPESDALARDGADVGYPPIEARIAYERGLLLSAIGRPDDSESAFRIASQRANAARDDDLELEAWLGLAEVRARRRELAGVDVLLDSLAAARARVDDAGEQANADIVIGMLQDASGHHLDGVATAERGESYLAKAFPGTLIEADAHASVSMIEQSATRYREALERDDAALAIYRKELGDDHPQVAQSREDRASTLIFMSQLDDAKTELEAVAATMTATYGADSLLTANAENLLGVLDDKRGNYDAAKAHFEKALVIRRAHGSEAEVAQTLISLGQAAYHSGDPHQAITLLEDAKGHAERAGDDNLRANALQLLGSATVSAGELEDGVAKLLEAKQLMLQLYGPDSPLVGEVDNELGAAHDEMGRHDRAPTELENAIAIATATSGADSLDALFAENNYGNERVNAGDPAGAIPHHERALAGLEKLAGPDAPFLTAPLAQLAWEYSAVGRAADGVAAGERGAAILAKDGKQPASELAVGLGAARYAAGQDHRAAIALVRVGVATLRGGDDPAALARGEAWLAAHPR